MIVFCSYSLAMVEIFGLVRTGKALDDYANFRTFPWAFLTLFRMTTGENWNQIMHDLMVEYPNCIRDASTYLLDDCGSRGWALVLVLSFEVLVTLFLMNLFVATIINTFDFSQSSETSSNTSINLNPNTLSSNSNILNARDLKQFKRAWAEFDPKATGYIQRSNLIKLFHQLDGTQFEMRIYDKRFSINEINQRLNVLDSSNSRLWLRRLNGVLRGVDAKLVKRRRESLNFVYQEAISHEDADKGIPFDKVLCSLYFKLVTAEHYLKYAFYYITNVITCNYLSHRIDQMFIRQQEVLEISEKIHKEKVKSLLKTFLIRRRYLKSRLK